MSKSLNDWFSEYSESHQNYTNQLIHCFAIPCIYIAGVALLWGIPLPDFLSGPSWVNWSLIGYGIFVVFFLKHSVTLGVGVLLFCILSSILCVFIEQQNYSLIKFGVLVFVVGWIFQFIGHHIEGKKPSFFKDFQFLLIGPGWVLAKLYKKLNIPF